MNVDVGSIASWAGAVMTIIGLLTFFVRPFLTFISKNNEALAGISETLMKVGHNLDLLTKDLESSKSDRELIHKKVDNQDERLDKHEVKLAKHDEQIKSLFKKGA